MKKRDRPASFIARSVSPSLPRSPSLSLSLSLSGLSLGTNHHRAAVLVQIFTQSLPKQSKEPCRHSKGPCRHSKELCRNSKETCKQSKEPHTIQIRPYTHSKNLHRHAKEPYRHWKNFLQACNKTNQKCAAVYMVA